MPLHSSYPPDTHTHTHFFTCLCFPYCSLRFTNLLAQPLFLFTLSLLFIYFIIMHSPFKHSTSTSTKQQALLILMTTILCLFISLSSSNQLSDSTPVSFLPLLHLILLAFTAFSLLKILLCV